MPMPMSNDAYEELDHRLSAFIPAQRRVSDPLRLLTWGTDASFYRLVPRRVVVVDSEDEVRRILQCCTALRIAVTFRAAGTSLSGQALSDSLLVVLGDVAGALPGEIDALFDALASLGGRGVVLAPSSDGGSSALLRAPADAIPACFGPDSAKRHRDAAAGRGVPFRELPLASLALDLDVPEDVEQFLRSRTGGAATRRALRRKRA